MEVGEGCNETYLRSRAMKGLSEVGELVSSSGEG